MANSLVLSNSSILIFFAITLLYFFIKYKTSSHTLVYSIIYILSIIGAELASNISLSQSLCGSPQWNTALMVTLIPWVIIFTLLNLLLNMFPGWLIPFSNTFGYGIAKLFGLQEAFNNVLKADNGVGSKGFSTALADIYRDPSLLINEIPNSTVGFEQFWNKAKDGGILKNNVTEENKENLRLKVKLKNIVAEFIWFGLTGLLTISASYNYIIKSACSHSVKEMEQKHKDYEDDIADEQARADIPPRIYSTYE